MTGIYKSIKLKLSVLPLPVRTSVFYVLCSILQKGISFIAVPIYTRMIPADQYGIYSIFQSWDSVLCIFATWNMWNYLFNNGMLKYEKRKNEFTSALIGLSTLMTLLLLGIYLLVHNWFYSLSGLPLAVMLFMFLDFFLRPSYEYWCARKRFEYDIKGYMTAAIIISVITPVVSVAAITYCNGTRPAMAGNALIFSKVICGVIVYAVVFFILVKKCRQFYDKKIWKFALQYNFPLIPHFLSGVILQQSDRIMIGSLCGNDKAGIYSVAYSIAAVIQIINTAVMDSIIPWMYKNMRDKKYDKIPFIGSLSTLLIAAVNIFAALCAPEIIAVMGPEEYRIASYIIPPVAISNVFIFMFNLFANVEYFYEETKFVMAASCISAVANILLNYIFIRQFGFIAAGYTTVACYMLYAFCHMLFMKAVLKKHGVANSIYNIGQLWRMAMAATILALLVIGLYPYPAVRLLIGVSIAAILIIGRKKIAGAFLEIKNKYTESTR